MGPAPNTTAVSPIRNAARVRECRATASGLDDGAFGGAEIRRQRQQILCGQIYKLAKESGFADGAQEADARADVVVSSAAVLTVVTVQGRFEDGGVSDGPSGDSGSDF